MLLCPKVLRTIVFVNKKIKKFRFFFNPLFLPSKTRKKAEWLHKSPKSKPKQYTVKPFLRLWLRAGTITR